MTSPPDRSWRRRLLATLPALGLLGGLAVAWLLPTMPFVSLGHPVGDQGDELHRIIGALPDEPYVLVDIDADFGTYPEIRYATRAALADLVAVGARLGIVSFTAEGRAIAVAELARLRSLGAGDDRLLDLGFRSGGEAALVQLAGSGIGSGPSGPVADEIRARGGLARFDLALIVGGTDIGPRAWIEQVQPRVPALVLAAVTPTFLLPEVQPYRDSGQLAALEGTLPAGVAYGDTVARGGVTSGPGQLTERAPNGTAILLGMLVAIVVLALASGGTVASLGVDLLRRLRS